MPIYPYTHIPIYPYIHTYIAQATLSELQDMKTVIDVTEALLTVYQSKVGWECVSAVDAANTVNTVKWSQIHTSSRSIV